MTKSLSSGPVLKSMPLKEGLRQEITKFMEILDSSKNILISSTLTSDGDSIGSQVALAWLLHAYNPDAKITIVNESPVPERYAFLADCSKIMTMDQWRACGDAAAFDCGITCDGGVERTGSVAALFENISNLVLIDHHAVGSQLEYQSKILEVGSSSTCEIVYLLYECMGKTLPAEMAEHLYVGIVFDTGFFKHSITTARTHYVAAELIKTGIDFSSISDRAILERSPEAQELLHKMMVNRGSLADGKIVYSYWSLQDLNEIDYKDGDQEGMINQLYMTQGAEIVALLTELDHNTTKISFRSKGDYNVAEFAKRLNPQGGGHIRASGCTLSGSFEAAKEKVLSELQKLIAS